MISHSEDLKGFRRHDFSQKCSEWSSTTFQIGFAMNISATWE